MMEDLSMFTVEITDNPNKFPPVKYCREVVGITRGQ